MLPSDEQGAALRNRGPNPHTAPFSPFTNPLDSATWNLNDIATGLNPTMRTNPSLELDALGKPLTKAVFLFDPTVNPMKAFGATTPLPVTLSDGTTATTKQSVRAIGFGTLSSDFGVSTNSLQYVNKYAVATESVRTPTTFKFVSCTTVAATALWTPTAGKKFRVMGGTIVVACGAAAAGLQQVNLLDSATDVGIDFQSYIPAAVGLLGVGTVIPFDLKPNGYLSAAANNVLNVTLGLAATAGAVSVTVWGTEE